MNIAIYGKRQQDQHLDRLRQFLHIVGEEADNVYLHSKLAGALDSYGIELPGAESVTDIPDDVGLVISLGGDGTFLRAVAWTEGREIPVMGINTGHLGYLSGFTFDDMEAVRCAIRGDFGVSRRMTLKIVTPNMPDDFFPFALNEIAVLKGDTTSMVSVRAHIDGFFLADYLADGLVLATPTGSTAYSLSAGGPIMQPTLRNILLTPVAAHSLTMRPLAISADSQVRLEVNSRGAECHVSCDGRTFAVPSHNAHIEVTRGTHDVLVAQPRQLDFATVLRNKLLWGKGRD